MNKQVIKNFHQERRLITHRIKMALFFIVMLILVISARLTYLQIYRHDHYTTLAKQNRIEIVPLPPTRGLIYDRNGVLLAQNIPVFSLDVIPAENKNINETVTEIQKIIPLSTGEIENFQKMLHQKRRFENVPLKLKLSDEEVAKYSVHRHEFPGTAISARLIREYPLNDTAAHTVGYVGRINARELEKIDTSNYSATNYIGKVGIEKYYEDMLHGTVGYQRIEVDAGGNFVRAIDTKPPIPGKNLYLTIDSKLQRIAQDTLKDHEGAVVAIDPQSGEILALTSTPSYNPNQFVKGLSSKQYLALQKDQRHPLYNRALRGLYAPGSTIKPFIALRGLETNTITAEHEIYDPGYFKLSFSSHLFHDWKRGGHGMVNLHDAIVESCDTYFYWLAYHLKIQQIHEVLTQFGFGAMTGIDMNEELPGIVPSPEWKQATQQTSWYPGDTLISGIGQGYMLATALQLASATATLSMHGEYYRPHLLYASAIPDQTPTSTLYPSEKRITLNQPENWGLISNAMQGVITEKKGTGFRFGKDAAYTVAAKTGTAQVYTGHKTSGPVAENLRDNGLFIAFAPVENPKLAIAVIVEHSGTTAPHVARKLFDAYLTEEPQQLQTEHEEHEEHDKH